MSGRIESSAFVFSPHPERLALPALAFGLRLLALAIVAAAALVLPVTPVSRGGLGVGILAGGLLGLVEYRRASRLWSVLPGELLVLAQVGLWTYLVSAFGGEHSPLFVGFLLEVPLAALALSHRGALLAAAGGTAGFIVAGFAGLDGVRWPDVTLVGAFLALAAGICCLLATLWQRQQDELALSRAALVSRAGCLSEELRLLGDYLGSALIVLDDLGRVVRINSTGLELLATTPGAALGRAWQEVLRVDAAGAEAVSGTLVEGEARRGVPLLVRRADGVPLPLTAELWVSGSPEGRRVHLLLEPARAAAAGHDPLQRLGEAVSCVAHQIKNSLHALQGYVQEIEVGPGATAGAPGEGHPYLVALQSLGELADDILAMAGAPRPVAERLALRPLLATAVLLARRSRAAVRVDVTGECASVLAPRGPLVHALFNLLDNACRVTRPGYPVRVRLARLPDRVCIEIEDGGDGLAPELCTARGRVESNQGSGLGLMAARRFLEVCGGELTFAGAPGAGTLCRVMLPAAPAATTPPARTARASAGN